MMTCLVDCATRSEDIGLVKQVLGRMSKVGLMPSLSSVTSLLQVRLYIEQGAKPRARHL